MIEALVHHRTSSDWILPSHFLATNKLENPFKKKRKGNFVNYLTKKGALSGPIISFDTTITVP